MKRLLAMRGLRNPKQKKVWEDGSLFAKPTVISLRGGTKWVGNDNKDEKMENWVTKGHDGESAWNNLHVIKLRHMGCPAANKGLKLKI